MDNVCAVLDSDEPQTPPKKVKRLSKYRKEWEATLSWLREESCTRAYCVLCKKSFSFIYGGLSDIKRHAESTEHKKHELTVKQNTTLRSFLSHNMLDSEQEK